jgi:hypothetical protein
VLTCFIIFISLYSSLHPCSSVPTTPSAPPITSSSTQISSISGIYAIFYFALSSAFSHILQHPKQVGCDAGCHGLLVRKMHDIHQVRARLESANVEKHFQSPQATFNLIREQTFHKHNRTTQIIFCTTSDCVMAELEKLGSKYKVALRIARDSRFERLPCQHKGTCAPAPKTPVEFVTFLAVMQMIAWSIAVLSTDAS